MHTETPAITVTSKKVCIFRIIPFTHPHRVRHAYLGKLTPFLTTKINWTDVNLNIPLFYILFMAQGQTTCFPCFCKVTKADCWENLFCLTSHCDSLMDYRKHCKKWRVYQRNLSRVYVKGMKICNKNTISFLIVLGKLNKLPWVMLFSKQIQK